MSSPISNTYTGIAGADLRTKAGKVARCSGADSSGAETIVVATDATALTGHKIVGCIEEGADTGGVVSIIRGGPARGRAGGAIPATTLWLANDADGDYVPAVSGDQACARYKGAFAAVEGDEIDIDVCFYTLP